MGMEIERKFLVDEKSREDLRAMPGTKIRQGYLSTKPERVVRIRVSEGEGAFLTVKGKTEGISRPEIETPIDPRAAEEMLLLAEGSLIEKIRRRIAVDGKTWEVDEFLGENAGLWVAEIELASEKETFGAPPWIGEEISFDHRFQNANLAREPWKKFGERSEAEATTKSAPISRRPRK